MLKSIKERLGITRKFSNDRRRMNRLLKKNGIDFVWEELYDGYKWTFPKHPDWDIVIHSGSYSSKWGYFETMGIEEDCTPHPANEIITLLKGE